MNQSPILIRHLTAADAHKISAAFAAQGWHKSVEQYTRYYAESVGGQREVLLADYHGEFAGYLTIVWQSNYPPFRAANIPEVVDFNVLEKFQRLGIGTQLMQAAEDRIAQVSTIVGIGVGLMHDYGKAQILYAKRGYIPDGRGIYSNQRWLNDGDPVTINHEIALYMTKSTVI